MSNKFLEDAYDEPLITESPWQDNVGTMPDLPEGTLVELLFCDQSVWTGDIKECIQHEFEEMDNDLRSFAITKWRFHKPSDAEYYQQPKTAFTGLTADIPYSPEGTVQALDAQGNSFAVSWHTLEEPPKRNKYMREIKPNVWVDVYDVIRAWEVSSGPLQHLLKKALCPGKRIHKDEYEDLKDILASAKRAVEIYEEWNK